MHPHWSYWGKVQVAGCRQHQNQQHQEQQQTPRCHDQLAAEVQAALAQAQTRLGQTVPAQIAAALQMSQAVLQVHNRQATWQAAANRAVISCAAVLPALLPRRL